MNLRPKSVRARLSLLFGASMLLLIGIYSASLFALFRQNVLNDLDRSLRDDIETIEMFIEKNADHRSNGFKNLQDSFSNEVMDPANWLTEVWTANGERVLTSGIPSSFPLGKPGTRCASTANVESKTLEQNLKIRTYCMPSEAFSDALVIRVARLTERSSAQLSSFLSLMLIGAPLIVLCSIALGYWLAKRSLAPISSIVEKAKVISAENLSERLPVENKEDELGELAHTFNAAFERLERSFQQTKLFTSDASHELRTPLSAIRTMGEIALRQPRTSESYQETLASILEETNRLQKLCDALLTLSRADNGSVALNRQHLELRPFIEEVIGTVGVLAEEKNQNIAISIEPALNIQADPLLFKQAILNLLDNAIKYGPNDSTISVSGRANGTGIYVAISDQGPGISSEHQDKIFDRFYRVDPGRTRDAGGSGLGLAICKWIVTQHNGEINVNSIAGQGAEFIIRLPG